MIQDLPSTSLQLVAAARPKTKGARFSLPAAPIGGEMMIPPASERTAPEGQEEKSHLPANSDSRPDELALLQMLSPSVVPPADPALRIGFFEGAATPPVAADPEIEDLGSDAGDVTEPMAAEIAPQSAPEIALNGAPKVAEDRPRSLAAMSPEARPVMSQPAASPTVPLLPTPAVVAAASLSHRPSVSGITVEQDAKPASRKADSLPLTAEKTVSVDPERLNLTLPVLAAERLAPFRQESSQLFEMLPQGEPLAPAGQEMAAESQFRPELADIEVRLAAEDRLDIGLSANSEELAQRLAAEQGELVADLTRIGAEVEAVRVEWRGPPASDAAAGEFPSAERRTEAGGSDGQQFDNRQADSGRAEHHEAGGRWRNGGAMPGLARHDPAIGAASHPAGNEQRIDRYA